MSEPYMMGVSVQDTIGMLLRCHNELHNLVIALQDRVLQLEDQLLLFDIVESGDNE